MKKWAAMLGGAILLASIGAALADPPSQAPAHGWRKKHDPQYLGYSGRHWDRDYEVRSGRCNRDEIGAVLGGVAGAVIGSQVSSRENRTVATIAGAVIGAIIGARIGDELDDDDRACFGHTLEIGSSGRRVVWDNPRSGAHYVLIPGSVYWTKAGPCRSFTLITTVGRDRWQRRGNACEADGGVWRLR